MVFLWSSPSAGPTVKRILCLVEREFSGSHGLHGYDPIKFPNGFLGAVPRNQARRRVMSFSCIGNAAEDLSYLARQNAIWLFQSSGSSGLGSCLSGSAGGAILVSIFLVCRVVFKCRCHVTLTRGRVYSPLLDVTGRSGETHCF